MMLCPSLLLGRCDSQQQRLDRHLWCFCALLAITASTRSNNIVQGMRSAFRQCLNVVLRQSSFAPFAAVIASMILGKLNFFPLHMGQIIAGGLQFGSSTSFLYGSMCFWMCPPPGRNTYPVSYTVLLSIGQGFGWMCIGPCLSLCNSFLTIGKAIRQYFFRMLCIPFSTLCPGFFRVYLAPLYALCSQLLVRASTPGLFFFGMCRIIAHHGLTMLFFVRSKVLSRFQSQFFSMLCTIDCQPLSRTSPTNVSSTIFCIFPWGKFSQGFGLGTRPADFRGFHQSLLTEVMQDCRALA
jgi:hypothetical protein